jgi:phosphopantetheine adenylyltransferase
MGGIAGHMAHPYELSWVTDGKQLISFFEQAKTAINERNCASLKVDGVNVSFKLVKEGKNYEFAVDRGTKNDLDVQGVTLSRINDRFSANHGLKERIFQLLTILNEALPSISPELKRLGMFEDQNRFLNTEFVSNTTNVIEHKGNFLAIHGVNKLVQRGSRGGSREVKYDQRVFERLIKKLKPVAESHNFNVFGQILTESTREIDFYSALEAPCTVRVSSETTITKSLREWLTEASNTHNERVKIYNQRPVNATSRKIFNYISEGSPIIDFIQEQDAQKAIYGFVMVEATRRLGQVVLDSMSCPLGEVKDFEGVVLRNGHLNPYGPVKITGNFIINGQNSPFNQVLGEEQIIGEDQTIAIVPGAFKPPHRGHLHMVEEYSKRANNVVVLISAPLKNNRSITGGQEITAEHSKRIWEMLITELDNVDIQVSPKASPINAAYDFVTNGKHNQSTKFIIGASKKGNDFQKVSEAFKNVTDVNLLPLEETAIDSVHHSDEYMGLLENFDLKQEMPSIKYGKDPSSFHSSDMRYLMSLSTNQTAMSMLNDFLGEDVTNEVLSIFEGSSAATVGSMGHSQDSWKPRSKKKNQQLRKVSSPFSSVNESIINEVYQLIMSRGLNK